MSSTKLQCIQALQGGLDLCLMLGPARCYLLAKLSGPLLEKTEGSSNQLLSVFLLFSFSLGESLILPFQMDTL